MARSDESATDPTDADPPKNNWNLASRTLGGKQFWADRVVFRGLRIQKNVLTGHFRLVDEKEVRRAWGTEAACQAKLAEIKKEKNLAPIEGEVVVVLHGLMRSRGAMSKMAKFLDASEDLTALNVGYASSRGTVADHAAGLAEVIGGLPTAQKIHFVCHSLGNLVVRHYLHDLSVAKHDDRSRFGRMVMLGPPNHQPVMAQKFIPWDISGQITGPAAKELASQWSELEPKLATPKFPFAIVAGGSGEADGRNPLIEGDDDLVVSVASTRLAGAADFRVLPVWHTTMMNDETVQELTLKFLTSGHFESDEKRQPIC